MVRKSGLRPLFVKERITYVKETHENMAKSGHASPYVKERCVGTILDGSVRERDGPEIGLTGNRS
jgi:hypothetical protein